MRTYRPLALLVGLLLLVALTTGVAAAQGGGGDVVSVLERLVDLLQAVIEFLQSTGSTG